MFSSSDTHILAVHSEPSEESTKKDTLRCPCVLSASSGLLMCGCIEARPASSPRPMATQRAPCIVCTFYEVDNGVVPTDTANGDVPQWRTCDLCKNEVHAMCGCHVEGWGWLCTLCGTLHSSICPGCSFEVLLSEGRQCQGCGRAFHEQTCAGGASDHCILCWQIWFGEPVMCGGCDAAACQLRVDESWAIVCQATNASVESVLPRALQGRRNSQGKFQLGMANPAVMRHIRVPGWEPSRATLPLGCTKKIVRLLKLDGLNRVVQGSQGSFEAFRDEQSRRHGELTESNMVERITRFESLMELRAGNGDHSPIDCAPKGALPHSIVELDIAQFQPGSKPLPGEAKACYIWSEQQDKHNNDFLRAMFDKTQRTGRPPADWSALPKPPKKKKDARGPGTEGACCRFYAYFRMGLPHNEGPCKHGDTCPRQHNDRFITELLAFLHVVVYEMGNGAGELPELVRGSLNYCHTNGVFAPTRRVTVEEWTYDHDQGKYTLARKGQQQHLQSPWDRWFPLFSHVSYMTEPPPYQAENYYRYDFDRLVEEAAQGRVVTPQNYGAPCRDALQTGTVFDWATLGLHRDPLFFSNARHLEQLDTGIASLIKQKVPEAYWQAASTLQIMPYYLCEGFDNTQAHRYLTDEEFGRILQAHQVTEEEIDNQPRVCTAAGHRWRNVARPILVPYVLWIVGAWTRGAEASLMAPAGGSYSDIQPGALVNVVLNCIINAPEALVFSMLRCGLHLRGAIFKALVLVYSAKGNPWCLHIPVEYGDGKEVFDFYPRISGAWDKGVHNGKHPLALAMHHEQAVHRTGPTYMAQHVLFLSLQMMCADVKRDGYAPNLLAGWGDDSARTDDFDTGAHQQRDGGSWRDRLVDDRKLASKGLESDEGAGADQEYQWGGRSASSHQNSWHNETHVQTWGQVESPEAQDLPWAADGGNRPEASELLNKTDVKEVLEFLSEECESEGDGDLAMKPLWKGIREVVKAHFDSGAPRKGAAIVAAQIVLAQPSAGQTPQSGDTKGCCISWTCFLQILCTMVALSLLAGKDGRPVLRAALRTAGDFLFLAFEGFLDLIMVAARETPTLVKTFPYKRVANCAQGLASIIAFAAKELHKWFVEHSTSEAQAELSGSPPKSPREEEEEHGDPADGSILKSDEKAATTHYSISSPPRTPSRTDKRRAEDGSETSLEHSAWLTRTRELDSASSNGGYCSNPDGSCEPSQAGCDETPLTPATQDGDTGVSSGCNADDSHSDRVSVSEGSQCHESTGESAYVAHSLSPGAQGYVSWLGSHRDWPGRTNSIGR